MPKKQKEQKGEYKQEQKHKKRKKEKKHKLEVITSSYSVHMSSNAAHSFIRQFSQINLEHNLKTYNTENTHISKIKRNVHDIPAGQQGLFINFSKWMHAIFMMTSTSSMSNHLLN